MSPPAIVLLLLLSLLAAPSVHAVEHVLTLDADNFDDEVSKADFIVVEFYAPWCGHCKSLAPEYEKAAKALKEEGSSIVLAKVDADDAKNKALAAKFGVRGFPTLKILRKGVDEPEEYKGPRDAAGIVSFLKKLTGPATQEVTSKDTLQGLGGEEDIVVVGVFSSLESDEFAAFSSVASALRSDFVFAHTTDASILPKGPAIEPPAVRLLKSFDGGFSDTTDFDVAALKAFVKKESVPLVVEMSPDPKHRAALQKVFDIPHNKSLLFFSYSLAAADALKSEYSQLAKDSPPLINFIIGEASQNDHALKYFGLTEDDTPVIIIHDPSSDAKYHQKNVEASDLKPFLDSFQAGKLERHLKSEPIPEANDGPVTVLVGKNFQEIVVDSKKNVLLEFYAPWCGHCQKLEPIYKEVGTAFSSDPDVIIAKMDYTANDIPTSDFTVKGFPTIFFYSAKGEVIQYDGDRSKDDLVKFVKKNKTPVNESSDSAEEKELEAELKENADELKGEAHDEL